jgi:F0F1-type ATP synthase membrane subunit b/b'
MDDRQRRIVDQAEQASRALREAEEEARRARDERAELEARRAELFEAARASAEERRSALTASARAAVEQTRAAWMEALEREKSAILREFSARAEERLWAALRQGFRDLADQELDARITSSLLTRLAGEGPLHGAVTVATAFEPDDEARRRIVERLPELGASEVRFEREPELVAGAEVRIGDRALSFCVRDYVFALQELSAREPGPSPAPADGGAREPAARPA